MIIMMPQFKDSILNPKDFVVNVHRCLFLSHCVVTQDRILKITEEEAQAHWAEVGYNYSGEQHIQTQSKLLVLLGGTEVKVNFKPM